MPLRETIVIGNWKQNPATRAEAVQLIQIFKRRFPKQVNVPVRVVVAPPFPFLDITASLERPYWSLGAQDVSTTTGGAFTGDVSVAQLASCGVTHIIIGHSERRARGETDTVVVEKVKLTLAHKCTPVVCVGEVVRDTDGIFFSAVEAQIKSLASALTATEIKKTVIAYEPIWAIGTGKTATVEDVKEMQLFIQSVLTKLYDRTTAQKVTLIYGGSVKPNNVTQLHSGGGMAGFLVGGASLVPDDFIMIVKSVITSYA